MATRTEYNQCIRPFITGTGRSNQERKLNFCIGAKVCSGKAKTPEEAKQICLTQPPKPPKQPKQRRAKGCPPCPPCDGAAAAVAFADLPCPESRQRAIENLDIILTHVKEGMAVKSLDLSNQVYKDIAKCHQGDGVPELAKELVGDLQDLSKRYYFKSEINEMKGKVDILRAVI